MENYSSDHTSVFEISFDERIKSAMREAAAWAGIAAMLSLANSILGLISYFVRISKVNAMLSDTGLQGARQPMMAGLLSPLISVGIAVVLFIFLMKFSRSARQGIAGSDNYLVSEGLGGLATYFKIVGILIIIVLSFVALAVLFSLAAGV